MPDDANLLAQRMRDQETAEYALMLTNTSDPDGVVSAGESTLFWDSVNEALSVNDDGVTSWTLCSGKPYGSMFIPGVDIIVIIGGAAPVEVKNAADDGWDAGELFRITFPAGGDEHYLTITKAGVYEILWNMSFHTDIGGADSVHGGVMVDSVAVRDNGEAHRDVSNSNDSGNISAPCIADLPNGTEEISLWISSDQSHDIHVEHATVTVKFLRET